MKRLNLCLFAFFACLSLPVASEVNHVNWENHPVHPVDRSPDGRLLAVAHTADARVQFFDISEGRPVPVGHVVVGLDPVSVRFRNNDQLWVVNHVSDSISIIDVDARVVTQTVATADEPYDVVFAGSPLRAWVSSSQTNTIQRFSVGNPNAAPVDIPILGEDPRALAVSPDGATVYAAIFESGNATTVVSGASNVGASPPNAVNLSESPYGGQNPPPNDGAGFTPALNGDLPSAPRVAQIVRKSADGRWLDDNGGDWTAFVSGDAAMQSGRVPGWDLPDRDIAVIDTSSLEVSYISGLMTMSMSLSVNPGSGDITLVGTEARNEIRFEPNVNGVFAVVRMAVVDPSGGQPLLLDLNPHLDYTRSTLPPAQRRQAIGDPRGIVWTADGSRGYVAGMGSNNVIAIDATGRLTAETPIEVGEGPIGLALSADESLLYVWNHFEASLSVVEIGAGEVQRLSAFNPLPEAIRDGRRHFYGTHDTSGLGHLACASCHVDGRTDRLAWDLGDPSGEVKAFNQNCSITIPAPCQDFHPMKGPMLTQTLQDIIGKEPFHWRGDRDGLEEFNGAFEGLQGAEELSEESMQEFEDFLDTITLPPNPYRRLDNALSTSVDLSGHVTNDRFGSAGRPLGSGNAVAGRDLFASGQRTRTPVGGQTHCTTCHSLPTGMGVNGAVTDSVDGTRLGGRVIPPGPNGENHLSVATASTNQGLTMKVPQLRTLYERTGLDLRSSDSRSGFGFLHDGTVGTLADMVTVNGFLLQSDQEVADMVAFLLSFSGSDLPAADAAFSVTPPDSQDSHAAVGQQVRLVGSSTARFQNLLSIAGSGAVDLVAHQASNGRTLGWVLEAGGAAFVPDDGGNAIDADALPALASAANPITVAAVPDGLGTRYGIDRDGDGVANQVEFEQGSDPADAASNTFAPIQGLWYNPARSGHGIDLQRAGDLLAGTWYTYEDDGTPTWYQAVGPFQGMQWSAELMRFRFNGSGVDGEAVGQMSFSFSSAREAEFCWTLGDRGDCEPFQRFAFSADLPLGNHTGLWFDPGESGYGLSVDSQGDVRVVVVYFYDANNDPRWVIGQGDNASANTLDMLSFTGFCPDCDDATTSNIEGGSLSVVFESMQRELLLDLDVDYPGLADSRWQRSGVTMVPLTEVPVDYGR